MLITDKIQRAIESGQFSCGIFLNLRKAFDTVAHDFLLAKFHSYGIRGTPYDWFVSYLSNRSQSVSIGNTTSSSAVISCGVPQGSVLGPLLFLLYINDFSNGSNLFDFHLFADDSNLFFAESSLESLETKVNLELKRIHNWLCCNKLSFNIDKTNFVIFHPPKKKLTKFISILVNNKSIEQKDYVKYLDVFIDSHLKFKEHIHQLSKKISRSIGILAKLRLFVSQDILIQLYYSLFYSFLTYGLMIWGNTYEVTLHPIIVLQKKAVRLITFSNYNAHTSPIFKHLYIMKFRDIIYYLNCVFMFKFYHNLLPSAFHYFFKTYSK